MKPDFVTAEMVRRVLLVLVVDEVRLAATESRFFTIGALLDHANAGLFCRALANEANDNGAVTAAEHVVVDHLGRRQP